jgi:hypothetical protein
MARRARAHHERPTPPRFGLSPDTHEESELLPPPGEFRVVPGKPDRPVAKNQTSPRSTVGEALREALLIDSQTGEGADSMSATMMLDAIAQSLEALPFHDVVIFIARLREIAQASRERASRKAPTETSVPLPRKAPQLWSRRDRSLKLNPISFTRMTYGPWLGKGLTRSHLRELDKALYHALANWISRHPGDAIPELPSQSEQLDSKIARLAEEFTTDELRRLGLALQARLKRSGN